MGYPLHRCPIGWNGASNGEQKAKIVRDYLLDNIEIFTPQWVVVTGRADIYVTVEDPMWSLKPETERGAAYVGVAVRGRVRLLALEASGICDQARKGGARVWRSEDGGCLIALRDVALPALGLVFLSLVGFWLPRSRYIRHWHWRGTEKRLDDRLEFRTGNFGNVGHQNYCTPSRTQTGVRFEKEGGRVELLSVAGFLGGINPLTAPASRPPKSTHVCD